LCRGLRGSHFVWRDHGIIRLDLVRDRVGFVSHGLSNGD
jgi:hypothetical protein